MILDELVDAIVQSERRDWVTIESGPLYGYDAPNQSRTVHVYRPDIAISAVLGAPSNTPAPGWVTNFPDKTASVYYMSLFHHGALVYQDEVISVDGGRATLPFPTAHGSLDVPRRYAESVRAFQDHATFDDYFARAQLKIIERPWP